MSTAATLRRRVRALESMAKDAGPVTVLIQPFRDGNVQRITSGAREWLRATDESVGAFRLRVMALTHEPTAGAMAVLLEHCTRGAATC